MRRLRLSLLLTAALALSACALSLSACGSVGPLSPTAGSAQPTAAAPAATQPTVAPTPPTSQPAGTSASTPAATATPPGAVAVKAGASPGASPSPGQVAAKPVEKPAAAPAGQPAAPPTGPSMRLPNVADAADKVRPAVAFIAVSSAPVRGAAGAEPRQGVGSGAIFDPRGYIVTNDHVVEGGTRMRVVLPDGRTFDARLVGRDPSTDLAVIKIDGQNLPVAQFGDSEKLKVGEWVVAIGNALGLEGGPTVTAGVVSALNRSVDEPNEVGQLENAIQTDTAINPGNSGGPLINLAGEIVGINTLVAASAGPGVQAQGIGFAIAINAAKPIVSELVAKGKVERPYLGVSLTTLTPAIAQQLGIRFVEGVVISQVASGSPAARAGLREGDVLTAIDADAVKNTDALRDALARRKVGDQVQLAIVRGGQQQRLPLTLGARPTE